MMLLDTDTCIEILRGNQRAIKRRGAYAGETAVSFMTVGELFYGAGVSAYPDDNNVLVEEFLLGVSIVRTDVPIMKRFGKIKAELKQSGRLLPDADILIAATTLEKAEALVTGNAIHFERIAGLKIENWIR